MKSYPIYINYDPTQLPIGHVEIDEDRVSAEMLHECAIVPQLIKPANEGEFKVLDFGLIPRPHVDTRQRNL